MVGKSKSATKEERKRFDLMIMGGCVACLQNGVYNDQVQIHHYTKGYRLGHSFTIALCPYHHQGLPYEGYTYKQMKEIAGPSLAHEKKAFHEKFGDDDFLLELQERVIEKVKESIV